MCPRSSAPTPIPTPVSATEFPAANSGFSQLGSPGNSLAKGECLFLPFSEGFPDYQSSILLSSLISKVWELPVSILLKLTIPQTSPSQWNRFYRSANIVLCPLALLYSCNSFMPLNHPISFLLPNSHFPLWLVVLFACSSLAVLHYIVQKEPPKTEEIPVVLIAFVMSVFWISVMAGELLNCLAALGALLELPPALLGLTVLAWGNSVGDLVADVAVAKAGQPALAMADCFAGPMFNMLFGLGTALVIQTATCIQKLTYSISMSVLWLRLCSCF
ncbi:hypothetical protein TEA_014083 [Camellia sinensis var. sinensis]|uniref:Sodium/calcium exchanger membrane region domain-containing protein n=1 Tax=Camellia sinensis var. sinensis TaxID=542762 RepID=A0A4V3WJW5_CAMSN|nr:hypothetical protein TEA_014083 [Camellia sinensis var. sinensis]